MATKKTSINPGMVLVLSYAVLFAANTLVIILANALFPESVVLGTLHISPTWAVIHSVGAITLIGTFALPFINQYESRRNKPLSAAEWMGMYFLINFAAIWIVSRFADQFGLGVSSWVVVAMLALVMDGVQGIGMMQLEKARTGS